MGDFNRNFDRRGSSRGRFDRRYGGGRFGGRDRGRDRGRSGGFDRRDRRPEMHPAVCDKCGKDCEVPFRPTEGKPIYCDDCFKSKSREAGSRSEFGKPNNNENIDKINKKLDRILSILEPKPVKEKQESKKPKSIEDLPVLEEPKSIEKPKKKAKKKK